MHGAIRDEDLRRRTDPAGKAIRARDLPPRHPVRVKGGYAFSLDDPAEENPRFLGSRARPSCSTGRAGPRAALSGRPVPISGRAVSSIFDYAPLDESRIRYATSRAARP